MAEGCRDGGMLSWLAGRGGLTQSCVSVVFRDCLPAGLVQIREREKHQNASAIPRCDPFLRPMTFREHNEHSNRFMNPRSQAYVTPHICTDRQTAIIVCHPHKCSQPAKPCTHAASWRVSRAPFPSGCERTATGLLPPSRHSNSTHALTHQLAVMHIAMTLPRN